MRILKIAMTVLRCTLAGGSIVVVFSWVVSRLVTDRIWWMQYPWWVPTVAWAGAALLLLGTWWAMATIAQRRRRAEDVRGGRVRAALAAIIALMLVHASVIEWRLHRWLVPVRAVEPAIRVAMWNPAVPIDTLQGPIEHVDADVIAIVNPPGTTDIHALVRSLGEDWQLIDSRDRLSILTRLPVKGWGFTRLGLEGRVMDSWRFRNLDVRRTEQYDEGRALFIELDAGDDSLVVWVVDLPSDVTLPRRRVMADAAGSIEAYEGRAYRFDGDGAYVEHQRFPEADVIVGDFNAVRGSWSLRQLVGDRVNAFDAAGRGWAGTFPRSIPLAQIDQMFVARDWKTVEYRIFDPGGGFHLAQVGAVTPRR